MSTDSNDMTETTLNYIEENRVRLEAEGADVPDRLRELLLQYSSQFKSFPDRESPIGKGDGRVGAL